MEKERKYWLILEESKKNNDKIRNITKELRKVDKFTFSSIKYFLFISASMWGAFLIVKLESEASAISIPFLSFFICIILFYLNMMFRQIMRNKIRKLERWFELKVLMNMSYDFRVFKLKENRKSKVLRKELDALNAQNEILNEELVAIEKTKIDKEALAKSAIDLMLEGEIHNVKNQCLEVLRPMIGMKKAFEIEKKASRMYNQNNKIEN